MQRLFKIVTFLLLLSIQVLAGDKLSCEISLVPKASQVVRDTFYSKPELAKEFISVLIEDHNLFFGPMILSYFDRVLVKKQFLKTSGEAEFTALIESPHFKANRKFLADFEKLRNFDKVVISNEIWKLIEQDLELNIPDVVEGLDVSMRFRKKILADLARRNLNPKVMPTEPQTADIELNIARMVQLRSSILKIMNEPSGTDLVKSFINQSLPFQAKFLSELQVNPKRDLKNTAKWTVVGIGSFSMLMMGSMGMAFSGMISEIEVLASMVMVGSSAALPVAGWVAHENPTTLSPIQKKQCEACEMLSKGLRKQLEVSGFLVDEAPALPGGLGQVRSLELSKLPALKSKEAYAQQNLELPHPLTMDSINSFGLDLIAQAKRVIGEAEALETSYESGIHFVLDRDSEFMNRDESARIAYRLNEIQRIQSYLQGVIDGAEALQGQLQKSIEYIKENVDAYNSEDDHLRQNLGSALEAQFRTLALAENRLALAREKVISLSTSIITESNLINEVNLSSSNSSINVSSLQKYETFLNKRRDPNVEAVVQAIELAAPPAVVAAESVPSAGEGRGKELIKSQSEIQLSNKVKDTLNEIATMRTYEINKGKTFSEKIIGRSIKEKYVSEIHYIANQNSFSKTDLFKWFKAVDDLGEQAGFRSSVNDDHLIRMAPLVLDRDLSPKAIMDRFFEIDILGSKLRTGWTIFDSAVALLTVTSFYYKASPRELVEKAFFVLDTLKKDHPTYKYSDLVLAEMVSLSYRYPNLSIEDLVKLQVQLWETAQLGTNKLDDMFVNVLFEALLMKNGGQAFEHSEAVLAVQNFYAIKGRFASVKMTEGQAAEAFRIGHLHGKTSEEVIPLLNLIVTHTGKDVALAIDCLNEILLRIASKRTQPNVTSEDVVETLRVIAKRGHKMLIDEFSSNEPQVKK